MHNQCLCLYSYTNGFLDNFLNSDYCKRENNTRKELTQKGAAVGVIVVFPPFILRQAF